MTDGKHRLTVVAVLLAIGLLWVAVAAVGCSKSEETVRLQVGASSAGQRSKGQETGSGESTPVTLVELGSGRCIPCIQMREVMKQVEERYGEQVRIVFHDVWTPEGEPHARQYRIRVIPTQVFLDAQGQEYYRHEGYFPFEQLAKILALKGVRAR